MSMASELEIEIGQKLKEMGGDQAAVRGLGYKRASVGRVATKMKQGWDPDKPDQESPESKPATAPRGKTIEVGKITIMPENWGMSQYGAILILDTYNKAKRDLDYGGTIGEFLCDVCEFYRRLLNYQEVEYATATSEGGNGHKADGSENVEPEGESGGGRAEEPN